MPADGAAGSRSGHQPFPGAGGVGHGLQGGEGLAGHHKERAAGIEPFQDGGEVGAVDIGDEMNSQIGMLPGRKSPYCHARTEV